jgi:hypothetical protein
MPANNTAGYLEYLRDAYTYKVNAALEQGRDDLAAELADDYLEEVRRALEHSSPQGRAPTPGRPHLPHSFGGLPSRLALCAHGNDRSLPAAHNRGREDVHVVFGSAIEYLTSERLSDAPLSSRDW